MCGACLGEEEDIRRGVGVGADGVEVGHGSRVAARPGDIECVQSKVR